MPQGLVCIITMEIEIGPGLRSALDVLDFVHEVLPLVPDYLPEKYELERRAAQLSEDLEAMLKSEVRHDGPNDSIEPEGLSGHH